MAQEGQLECVLQGREQDLLPSLLGGASLLEAKLAVTASASSGAEEANTAPVEASSTRMRAPFLAAKAMSPDRSRPARRGSMSTATMAMPEPVWERGWLVMRGKGEHGGARRRTSSVIDEYGKGHDGVT